ncbi:MAG: response regulator transcription factor [Lachnospiraceae bacterium]|nr:response regulator transcription factor [Lachnospiraceae bacterium]MBQ8634310.1 response regulator transcription factor [Lachnospiraceae bacterium]
MSNILKVIIADDHSMIREGLKQLLELDGDIQVIGEAGNGEECLELLKNIKPDIILLDINMPIMNGLKLLEVLRNSKYKNQKVLILTIHNEVEYLLKAVDIGVEGYVLKDADSSILKKAIYKVCSGENYIDSSMVPLMNERIAQEKEKAEEDKLTRREIEVLKLLAEGLFNKEIAYKLSISEKTVKNHVSNIFKKIGVFDRTQAAVYAIKNNIVEIY